MTRASISRASIEVRDVVVDGPPGPFLSIDSFTAVHGDVVAVCGPNGAGKSTFVKLLAGDLRPLRGSVGLEGTDTTAMSARELARIRSVMTQDCSVAFPFAVGEVVSMGRSPWGRSRDDRAIVERSMVAAEVAHLADRTVTSLSGGERARVALARVIAQDCAVVLLDEPTAALDLAHQEHLAAILRGLAADGRTIVVVLHDLSLAAAVASRVVLMCEGRVVAEGAPHDVIRPNLLSAAYRHPIDVLDHERVPTPIVVPRRDFGNTNPHGLHGPSQGAHQAT